MQIARGAAGVCCAKLGEAEVFAAAGIEDIRLPYPINPVNADRVLKLLDLTRLSFIVDDLDVARGWSGLMRVNQREVDVLVKVDVGFHRCGIDPEAATPPRSSRASPSCRGCGFAGSSATRATPTAPDRRARSPRSPPPRRKRSRAWRARSNGSGAVEEISVGATPTARFSLKQDGITELRPGNYIYFDRTQVALGAATWDDCALTVLARVVSRPAADRIILDCGSKTLSNDQARGFCSCPGFGVVFADLDTPRPDESLLIERLSEEHATVRVLRSGMRVAARRSRARPAEPRVRRVESRGLGVAGERGCRAR